MPKRCSVDACDNIVQARGWCTGHYSRWNNHPDRPVDLTPLRKPVRERHQICSVDGCNDLARNGSLCIPHHLRVQRTGDVGEDRPVRKSTPSACTVGVCSGPAIAKGLCASHYYRMKKWGDVRSDLPVKKMPKRNLDDSLCALNSCQRAAWADNLCDEHFKHNQYLRTRYRLTVYEYRMMLDAQDGVCAICQSDNPGTAGENGRFHVDHDHACCPRKSHSCGKCVRGLVCSNCNTALGGFRDDADILRRAIDYLESQQSEDELDISAVA